MKKITSLLLVTLLFLTSLFSEDQLTDKPLVPVGLTIIVNNLAVSTDWYKENLKFDIHKKLDSRTILHKDGFYLELKSVSGSISEKDLKLPEDIRFINGYSKFSFVVDNLKGLYNHLFINGVNVFRPITEGEFFQGKYFVITDSEGNFLQFISNNETDTPVEKIKMKPFLLSKMVDNVDQSVKWYESVLNCKVSEILNIPEHNLKLGYIEMNGFYFELIQTGVSTNKSELDNFKDKDIQGFSNLTIYSDNFENLINHLNNIPFDLTKKIDTTNFGKFKKQLNITDLSENNIQIIN